MVKLISLASLASAASVACLVQAAPRTRPSIEDFNSQLRRHTFVTDPVALATSPSVRTPQEAALALAKHHGAELQTNTGSDFAIRDDTYYDAASGLWHVYVSQNTQGIDIFNGGLHALVDGKGKVLSYSHNIYAGPSPSQATDGKERVTFCQKRTNRKQGLKPRGLKQLVFGTANTQLLSAQAALAGFLEKAAAAAASVRGYSTGADTSVTAPVDHSLSYVIDSNDCLILTHRFEVPMEDNHYEAYIDAIDGRVRAVADWTSPGTGRTFSLARPDFGSSMSGMANAALFALEEVVETAVDAWTGLSSDRDDSSEEYLPQSYKVFDFKVNDPSEAKRTYVYARHDPEVSPFGWHAHPANHTPFPSRTDKNQAKDGNLTKYLDTRGNNVFVSWGGVSNDDAWELDIPRPKGTVINGSRTFDYPYPWRKYDKAHEPLDPKVYANASQTQLFFVINELHDLLFHYGFDSASGNFEEFSKKGKDSDGVIAFAQSRAGSNNADFTTPPDGKRPRMRMYTWSGTPQRDGSFEEGIIAHEQTHGVSTRLTGGPSDSSCLGWGESGGMGEGWGDILATLIRDRNGSTPAFTMGEWASGRPGGIRKWPYSRNITVSPDTYETLNQPSYWAVHAAGEVWATIILDVVDHAQDAYGFSPTLFPPATNASEQDKAKFYLTAEEVAALPNGSQRASKRPIPRHGTTLMLQLLIDGMKIQPCRPDFLAARDAIVKAAEVLTGGGDDYACLLRHAFAKRGMGMDATVVGQTPWGGGRHTNGHQTPKYCNGTRHI